MTKAGQTSWKKKLMIAIFVLVIIAAAVYWYYATLKYDDTSSVKATYSVNAMDLIREYQANDSAANKKYRGQMIAVKGIISQLEAPDTATLNVKFIDSTGFYLNFQFQNQHAHEAKSLKEGQQITVKGECDGVAYSSILDLSYITFSRAAIDE